MSLIIPTFFNQELKRRSLRFLLAGLERSRCIQEIVLVSSDGEPQDFRDLKALAGRRPVRVVQSDPHNRGKSRNAGAAAATRPNLMFLDDDMLLRDWRVADVVLSELIVRGHDCALFPRRQYAKFPLLFDPYALQEAIDLWRRNELKRSSFLYDPLLGGTRDLASMFCFPGCFMMIRRAAYEKLQGFAEDFIGWGFEDTDFGVRAMRSLRVLNLFRTGEPLLHIDHPVSPYKSEEHNENHRRFYASPESLDVNLFSRRVFRGGNFEPENTELRNTSGWLEPLKQLDGRGVPLNVEQMSAWWMGLAHRRLRSHMGALPRFIVLHGSRAEGTARAKADHDVLCLFEGHVQEFFVSSGPARVEMECADNRRFDAIASHPALHSVSGPMELAKLAGARLLWGNPRKWTGWLEPLLRRAMENGWPFWLVLGLGLRHHRAKYGRMVTRYFRSLNKLRVATGCDALDFDDELGLAVRAKRALNESHPDWRTRMNDGLPIFELQVPEVWTGLHLLARGPFELVTAGPARARTGRSRLRTLALAGTKRR